MYSLHVVDSPEDTAHVFLYCPLYYTQRLAPQNIVSRYTEFKLETLLFETKTLTNVDNITIILAVHDYIKNQKGFSTIYLLICYVIYYFSKYCKHLQNSWYVSALVMCECVCYCAYFINVNKLYVHVFVLERAKALFLRPILYHVLS